MYGGFNAEDLGSSQDCLSGDCTGSGVSNIIGAGAEVSPLTCAHVKQLATPAARAPVMVEDVSSRTVAATTVMPTSGQAIWATTGVMTSVVISA
jgi:hypothetical protein